MRFGIPALAVSFLALAACGKPGAASDPSSLRGQGGRYVQRNLVSDGFVPAEHVDPNLVNAWGIARGPTTPWWVANNETATSTLYDGEGVARTLVVSVMGAGGQPAAPTGMVFNETTAFPVSAGGASAPARFLFASEDGTLSGWNPGVPPPATSTTSVVAVDNSASGAIYKGLAIASTPAGPRLYAANFHAGTVEVYDGDFAPVPGGFVDPGIPAGFAPFGIQAIGDRIYVAYAKQDDAKEDEVAGRGLGFVSAFGQDGTFLRRVASGGKLDAPWGLALAPAGFGRFSGRLLVGNFGDGHIVGFRLDRDLEDSHMDGDGGERHGERGAAHWWTMLRKDAGDDADDDDDDGAYLTGMNGRITIDGLWGLGFGNDSAAGPATTLFFAAGPDDEQHGLFGRIDFLAAPH